MSNKAIVTISSFVTGDLTLERSLEFDNNTFPSLSNEVEISGVAALKFNHASEQKLYAAFHLSQVDEKELIFMIYNYQTSADPQLFVLEDAEVDYSFNFPIMLA